MVDRAYLGAQAESYEARRVGRHSWRRETKLIDRLLSEMPPETMILDIPCGTGRLLPIAESYGHQVISGDLSIDMIRQLRYSRDEMAASRGLVLCDAERIPFANGSVDYVACLRFFHFSIPNATASKILSEFGRVARKGIILHIPLRERSLLSRVADNVTTMAHSPAEIVSILTRKLKRLRRVNDVGDDDPVDGGTVRLEGGRFSVTLAELENLMKTHGLTLACTYGAISPWSSKRICLFIRIGT